MEALESHPTRKPVELPLDGDTYERLLIKVGNRDLLGADFRSFKGRVEAVLPGIQAAFVDIGTEKAAFLHVSDVALDDAAPDDASDDPADDPVEASGGNGGGGGGGGRRGRSYPPIQDVVKKGQDLVVQVSKEPISTKGPRVTANISLPGRFLVYMPGSSHVGVSRKIEDREERARLRQLAELDAFGLGNLSNGLLGRLGGPLRQLGKPAMGEGEQVSRRAL